MPFKLVCVLPFHGVAKGQQITNPKEVERHLAEHDKHFVKVAMSAGELAEHPAPRAN
jgi:hypothetical protein